MPVPEVLVSGHHAEIAKWRLEQAQLKTRQSRPDLLHEMNGTDNVPQHKD
jgi:tRNA (guanine37-N1)-methyltransferase